MEARPNSKTAVHPVAGALRSWVMIGLTIVVALLYVAALMGWLTEIENERLVSRLEPIVFAILGYYFGRLPGQQNESILKEEIVRQAQKADAAQHAKEQTLQARESLEEKIRSARTVLLQTNASSSTGLAAEIHERTEAAGKEQRLRQSVAAALNILNP